MKFASTVAPPEHAKSLFIWHTANGPNSTSRITICRARPDVAALVSENKSKADGQTFEKESPLIFVGPSFYEEVEILTQKKKKM